MEYLYIREQIKDYLNIKIKEFELSEKIVYAITNNGANMKKAIRLLNSMKCLFYFAYMF